MVCCVRKLLLTLADVEATSLLPNSASMITERLHLIKWSFDKKGEHLFFFHIEIVLGMSMAQESSETYSLHISKAPSLGSFIFAQHSAAMLCPLSLAMEFDTFLFGF